MKGLLIFLLTAVVIATAAFFTKPEDAEVLAGGRDDMAAFLSDTLFGGASPSDTAMLGAIRVEDHLLWKEAKWHDETLGIGAFGTYFHGKAKSADDR